MKKEIIIVGAGSFGREVFQWGKASFSSGEFQLAGFIDDRKGELDEKLLPAPVLARIADYKPKASQVLVMGIAETQAKLKIAEDLLKRDAEFLTLIHPTVVVGDNVQLGKGVVCCPYAVISCNAKIGNFVALNLLTTVGHDTVIGDGCTFSSHNDVAGFAELGRGVFLGSHAAVLPKVKVGDFAVIAAGSVAYRNVRAATTVMGVPAKRLEL